MVVGTGKVDSEKITPLASLEAVFEEIENNQLTVMARRKMQIMERYYLKQMVI